MELLDLIAIELANEYLRLMEGSSDEGTNVVESACRKEKK